MQLAIVGETTYIRTCWRTQLQLASRCRTMLLHWLARFTPGCLLFSNPLPRQRLCSPRPLLGRSGATHIRPPLPNRVIFSAFSAFNLFIILSLELVDFVPALSCSILLSTLGFDYASNSLFTDSTITASPSHSALKNRSPALCITLTALYNRKHKFCHINTECVQRQTKTETIC